MSVDSTYHFLADLGAHQVTIKGCRLINIRHCNRNMVQTAKIPERRRLLLMVGAS
jgi:hypothetical protein